MLNVEIKKNFLDQQSFKDLKELITKSEFPWYQRKSMVPEGTTNNLGYFTHSFYNDLKVNCNTYYKYILPILDQLNSKAVIEVRANLAPSVFFNDKHCDFHTDNNFNCKTAILYLNTCDGGTEFTMDNKIKFIKAEENKIVIFNSNIEHRATTSKNCNFRYIVNFNYYNK